jgi:hypothetical protein
MKPNKHYLKDREEGEGLNLFKVYCRHVLNYHNPLLLMYDKSKIEIQGAYHTARHTYIQFLSTKMKQKINKYN